MKELLDVLGVHLLQQVFKRIHSDGLEEYALQQVIIGDGLVPLFLHKVGDLVVLWVHLCFYKDQKNMISFQKIRNQRETEITAVAKECGLLNCQRPSLSLLTQLIVE